MSNQGPFAQIFTTAAKFAPETALLQQLAHSAQLDEAARSAITSRAAELVRRIRSESDPTLMEHFLAEYGLSTKEGVALMCLAEALLRVPDATTMDALIEDKIVPSEWGNHLGDASSTLVNASTWALMLTGRVLDEGQPGLGGILRGAIKRLGEPVIRIAIGQVMKEMGRQFVLGQTISAALDRAKGEEAKGYTYSYDMLGEAAMTDADARRYASAYSDAIAAIAKACDKPSVAENPGISIKLSALSPRYEVAQEARVMAELVPVVLELAEQAKAASMGLNIDAEEQDRLVLSLKVIEAVLSSETLQGWDGFGVVVQAYGKRAGQTIDWLYALADRLDRRIMVRLVKGAYWDTEMKLAQVEGHPDFPLFTSKQGTDASYIANAGKLFGYADRIYPQFATHNAHTVAAVLELAGTHAFEFQRLHGMGERLHDIVLADTKGRCRIYAPVGAHQDLLAYLVRRLLENGANSSFVNQIVDESVSPEEVARDPLSGLVDAKAPASLVHPKRIFGARDNSVGFDLSDEETLALIEVATEVTLPNAGPLTVRGSSGQAQPVLCPTTGVAFAEVIEADEACIARAIDDGAPWSETPEMRAEVLLKAADLYEGAFGTLFAALTQEAGKSLPDAVSELREAVDFLRYYAREARASKPDPRGIFTAISPWNFPLAIFSGQIAAALAAGNGVLAKPAEQTPIVACIAIGLLHKAGVPAHALQLLPGGGQVGAALTSCAKVNGVAFTGSTATAKLIQTNMAQNMMPGTPFIAETGGLNAMILDSTALPEQAVRDVIASSFQSAGQRCSALRCLYVQEDVADHVTTMIKGAMDALAIGDPALLSTDVGPVIDKAAKDSIDAYITEAGDAALHRVPAPEIGTFVSPALIKVSGIAEMTREIFGPVLHIATYKAGQLDQVIDDINATGYGLTFGLHTRIDSRVQDVCDRVQAGNLYVNRNQIGAVVGSQPFGGEGLSGTGPKAGGLLYVPRFAKSDSRRATRVWEGDADLAQLQRKIDAATEHKALRRITLPGPTGEANTLSQAARDPILCLGSGEEAARRQLGAVEDLGGVAVMAGGHVPAEALVRLTGFSAILYWGDDAKNYALALASRPGAILPLITGLPDKAHVAHERHLCVDTTAAGGNASLLAG